MRKPTLCLDFDGVLHSYKSGWQGTDVIPDPPVPGALEFLDRVRESFDVAVFSSRSHQPGGKRAMQFWLESQFFKAGWDESLVVEILSAISWPEIKPPAFVTIDDRALTFDGTWPEVEMLVNFKPWNKKAV